jgi:probable HAF family extracellular repeat protein
MGARQVCSKLHSMVLLSMVAFALVVPPRGGFALTFSTIEVPGATHTDAQDISATGQIVGTYTDARGTQHGFLSTWAD